MLSVDCAVFNKNTYFNDCMFYILNKGDCELLDNWAGEITLLVYSFNDSTKLSNVYFYICIFDFRVISMDSHFFYITLTNQYIFWCFIKIHEMYSIL